MIEQGIVLAGYLSHDRAKGWLIIQHDSIEHACEVVESLPFAQYWQIEMTALLAE